MNLKNFLLLKIHNESGPSGFYFKADAKSKLIPAIATELSASKGSFAVEFSANAKENRKARVFWKDKKNNRFDSKRSSPEVMIENRMVGNRTDLISFPRKTSQACVSSPEGKSL